MALLIWVEWDINPFYHLIGKISRNPKSPVLLVKTGDFFVPETEILDWVAFEISVFLRPINTTTDFYHEKNLQNFTGYLFGQ